MNTNSLNKKSWLRKFLQSWLRKPVTRFALKVSSAPVPEKVFSSLTDLLQAIIKGDSDRGITLDIDINESRFIIFSDQHKGAGDLADDFHPAEKNYQTALNYYFDEGFSFINLGDCEELWECKPQVAVEKNKTSLELEAKFLSASRYYRVFGNHDLEWKYAIQQNMYLKPLFGDLLKVYEGLILRVNTGNRIVSFFMTHGHQGDIKSDGNAISKWIVAAIWTPVQRYLEINLNSLSDSFGLVDRHNIVMSEWSEIQDSLVLVSGHTHKPVFASMDHIDRLKKEKLAADSAGDIQKSRSIQAEIEKRKVEYTGKYSEKIKPHPSYFNTGCCCFEDGDISGIEIDRGMIRLIKWEEESDGKIRRQVLEESSVSYLLENL